MGVRGIMVDITERKKTENTLKESEEKFRTLAEESPNMIFINQDGKIVYVNPKCAETMGYTKDEYYSPEFNFRSLVAPESAKQVMASFSKHVEGKEVLPSEYSFVTKQGKRVDAILTTRLITYNGKQAILGTVTDITERKKTREELKRERQMLEHITERMGAVLAVISPVPFVLSGAMLFYRKCTKNGRANLLQTLCQPEKHLSQLWS